MDQTPLRYDAYAIFLPSREKTGVLSSPGSKLIRAGASWPAASKIQMSRLVLTGSIDLGRDAPSIGRDSRGPVVPRRRGVAERAFPNGRTPSAARARSFRLPRRRGALPGTRRRSRSRRPRGTERAAPRPAGPRGAPASRRRRGGRGGLHSRRRGDIPAARTPSSMRRAEAACGPSIRAPARRARSRSGAWRIHALHDVEEVLPVREELRILVHALSAARVDRRDRDALAVLRATRGRSGRAATASRG